MRWYQEELPADTAEVVDAILSWFDEDDDEETEEQ